MTREETRRINARQLADEAGGLAAFGRQMAMSDSQVSQIIGRTPKKNIGNAVGARIEAAFGKPKGWLDSNHGPDKLTHEQEESPAIVLISQDEIADQMVLLMREFRICTPNARKRILGLAISADKITLVDGHGAVRNQAE